MNPTLFITALLFAPLAALQAQTVSLTPSDAGLRVEIDGQLFTEYVTKDTPRPLMYPLIGEAGVNVARDFPLKKGVPGEERFLDHRHHRSPTTWHARDYGLFAVNPFGLHDFEPDKPVGVGDYTIKNANSLTLRYRFYFAKGQPKPDALDERFQDYAKAK
jgi:hypothetical protein